MLRLFRDLALVEAVKCQDIVCWKHQVMKAEINQQQLSMHERLWCAKELRWIIPKSYTCSKISSVVLQFQKQRFKVSQKKSKPKTMQTNRKTQKLTMGQESRWSSSLSKMKEFLLKYTPLPWPYIFSLRPPKGFAGFYFLSSLTCMLCLCMLEHVLGYWD